MSTYTAIIYHIVFSTKARTPVLIAERREDLFRYITGITNNRQGYVYRINGVEDHLHILTSLHPTVCLSDLVKDIKTGSARWIKDNAVFRNFDHWQEGYGAFTCATQDISFLIEYISSQTEHHRKRTFEEEYRGILQEAGIAFDERYMLK